MMTAPWQTHQMLLTFLLMTSEHPWKILVDMLHVSMKRMNDPPESFATWLEKVFFGINQHENKWCCSPET